VARLSESDARALTLGPDSVSWDRASDVRGYLAAGYALLLQVTHPTVGSGVRDHSDFTDRPWHRLLRTLDYVNLTVYSGHGAIEATGQLREMHRHIKGTNPDGSRYHALEPAAFAWVHATLVHAVVNFHERFGRPLTEREKELIYAEWLGLGRLVGLRPGDLPADWAGFGEYFDDMVENTLEHTETADTVLASISHPKRPPALPAWTDPVWRAGWAPAGHLLTLCTVGLLPPVLRERLGVTWTPRRERRLRAVCASSRALTPVLPRALRVSGPGYLRMRRLAA
jgi:uncharacterized protein (DUF2236 family)